MSRRASVPVLVTQDRNLDAFAQAVKQNMDWLTGQQKNSPPLKPLAATATLAEVIEQVNQLQKRLQ